MMHQVSPLTGSSSYQIVPEEETPTQRWKRMSELDLKNKVILSVSVFTTLTIISVVSTVYGATMYAMYGSKYQNCSTYNGGCQGDPQCLAQQAEGICDTQGGAIMSLLFGSMTLVAYAICSYLAYKRLSEYKHSNTPEITLEIKEKFLNSANPGEFISEKEDYLFNQYVRQGIFPPGRDEQFDQLLECYVRLERRKRALVNIDPPHAPHLIVNHDYIERQSSNLSIDEEDFYRRWNEFKELIKDEFPSPVIQELP